MQYYKYAILFLSLLPSFIYAQDTGESLHINWPEEYRWKIIAHQQTDSAQLLQLIPESEDISKWTILGQVLVYKGLSVNRMEDAMDEFIQSARVESPKAKLTLLESSNTTEPPWILFKIEAESFINDPTPESQLYYLVQSESFFYVSFVALKKRQLSSDFVKKWTTIFKSSKVIPKQVSLENHFQQYYDKVERFSLELPQHWKCVKQENSSVKLIAYRTKEAVDDIPRENINLNFIYAPNSNIDAEYAKLKNALLNGEDSMQLVAEGELNIDLKKVKWLIETHKNKVSGEIMQHYSFAYYSNSRMIILTCTAPQKTFDKHKETFEKIARSFKI